jgi:hypothetical protein
MIGGGGGDQKPLNIIQLRNYVLNVDMEVTFFQLCVVRNIIC